MKLIDEGDKLLLKDTPAIIWLLGCFFIIIGGLLVYGSSGGYQNIHEAPEWAIKIHGIFGFAGIGAGIYAISTAPLARLTIDREIEKVRLHRSLPFFTSDRMFAFEEIKKFDVFEEKDSDGDPIWYLTIILLTDEEIKVSSMPSPQESDKRDLAFEINTFMQKQSIDYR